MLINFVRRNSRYVGRMNERRTKNGRQLILQLIKQRAIESRRTFIRVNSVLRFL